MKIDDFVQQYLETALWSSTDFDDVPLDDNYGIDDIALETLAQAVEDCEAFRAANADDLRAFDEDETQSAHYFWLSRNGHGAGFFDAGTDCGDRLQKAARKFGTVNLYVGDDGKIYGV